MAVPEIIGSIRSTYTRAACMVCEEKAIDYVLTERPLHAPEILAIHPFGKMPVLRHGDAEIFESKAIATYLDLSFPAPFVFPSDPRRAALTEQWVSLVNTMMDRTLIRTYIFAYIAPGTADRSPDRSAIEAVMPAVREQLRVLDKAVASDRLSGRRPVHLRRYQSDADPVSGAAIPGRRRGARRRVPSCPLLRQPRDAAELCPHYPAAWSAGPGKAGLGPRISLGGYSRSLPAASCSARATSARPSGVSFFWSTIKRNPSCS